MPKYADEYGINEIFDILKATYLPKSEAPQPSTGMPLADRTVGEVGISRKYAREDHVHPSDTSKAPINSPNFLGTPTAPTAAAGTASQQIANTQFVQNALSNSGFQHALTAGSHIRIENNVISAYSIGDVDDVHLNGNSCVSHGVAHINDFQGATASAAGKEGLVPAPAVWEDDKFLCADGTWKSISESGGGGGGGRVNYAKYEQDTGVRWIDGRHIYQITFDLQDYTPESGTVGYTQYLIDVIDLDMSDVIDIEQPGRAYVDGGYIFTSIDGDVRTNYTIGLGSTREIFAVTIQSQSIYSIRYITVRYIKKEYVEYEWDFTRSLTDLNHGITFAGNATRDTSGVHLTLDTSLVLAGQGVDWTEVDNHYPSFDDWILELSINNVTPATDISVSNSILNMIGAQYTVLGFVYPATTWQLNVMKALGTVDEDLNVAANYFDGHTLRIRRHNDKLLIYRDSTLVYTHNITTSEEMYAGNVLGIGSVAAETENPYKSLPCTITRCKFSRIL